GRSASAASRALSNRCMDASPLPDLNELDPAQPRHARKQFHVRSRISGGITERPGAGGQIKPQFIHSREAGFWQSISMPNVSKQVGNSTMLSHCSTFSACL